MGGAGGAGGCKGSEFGSHMAYDGRFGHESEAPTLPSGAVRLLPRATLFRGGERGGGVAAESRPPTA